MTIRLHSTLLAQMRGAAQALMTDTCTIEARSVTKGDMGETVDAWETVASSVACRMQYLGQRFSEVADLLGDQQVVKEAYRLICPYGTSLGVGQRVTLDSDSSRWEVVDLNTQLTSQVDAQAIVVRARHGE